jgi:hypothetical protein
MTRGSQSSNARLVFCPSYIVYMMYYFFKVIPEDNVASLCLYLHSCIVYQVAYFLSKTVSL